MNRPKLKPYPCDICSRSFGTSVALADHKRDSHSVIVPATNNPICIECGEVAELVSGKEIYPHRSDLWGKHMWRCSCGAYCGCHGVTTRPLGYPCGPETRAARMAAHDAFDPLWRSRRMTRREAYTWLAAVLNVDAEACHIGMMDAVTARRVVEAVQDRMVKAS